MPNISAGVYTKIVDLSTYVQAVPGTIAFICALTEKGVDNVVQFVGSRDDLVNNYGQPNINLYGQNYSQGLYAAYNYLGESSSLYFMRALPSDASYSNLRINAVLAPADTTASLTIDYVEGLNTSAEITTNLDPVGNSNPLCILYPVGRGQYYNSLGVRFTESSNPLFFGVYTLDIYQKQSDGSEVIIESFDISFNPDALDGSGSSQYIEDVLATYSTVLRADVGEDGYDLVSKVYDKEIGTVTVDLTTSAASIEDNKQNFGDWENSTETGNSTYMVIAKDGKGNEIYGWLGAATGTYDDGINVFNHRDPSMGTQDWLGDTTTFDVDSSITYQIRKTNLSVADGFVSSTPAPLKKGTEGSMIDISGNLVTAVATQTLAQAYAGTIDSNILDTDNIYFTLVFDAGYPTDVKAQIVTLAQTREDCIAIIDNGDNASFNTAISTRQNTHKYNTYLAAIYEEYNKVYDIFTGRDVWFSPLYHMAYILPRNDRVAELWFAAAGFNRASINTIKDLRFNPRLGQRDQMYLNQLNPIVKFSTGYVIWSQLTTQAKASALQDLNIARLILYVNRALSQYAQNFIYEQNDAVTWGQVANDISEFLNSVKKKRGLYSYNVSVGATDYEKKTKTFHIDVTLEPVRTVEKIELNFFIK